jgi:hypothetical protein
MWILHVFRVCLAIIVLFVTCSANKTTAQTAATLTAVSGDRQMVPRSGRAEPLFFAPIVVKALDSNGDPIKLGTVTFKISQPEGMECTLDGRRDQYPVALQPDGTATLALLKDPNGNPSAMRCYNGDGLFTLIATLGTASLTFNEAANIFPKLTSVDPPSVKLSTVECHSFCSWWTKCVTSDGFCSYQSDQPVTLTPHLVDPWNSVVPVAHQPVIITFPANVYVVSDRAGHPIWEAGNPPIATEIDALVNMWNNILSIRANDDKTVSFSAKLGYPNASEVQFSAECIQK